MSDKTWKAKEWLKDNGFIQEITRGRISNENKIRLAEAAESGIRFSDFQANETTNTAGDLVVKNTVKANGGSQIENFNEAFIRYEGGDKVWKVTDSQGNDRSLTEACICGYSLIGHLCNDPKIVPLPVKGKRLPEGHVSVTVERK